ncbi:MAG: hypothetical protein ACL93V_14225 [Candidatus Electrothrix sp. YB6]
MSMTFEQVVEIARKFPIEQQEMLVDLIRSWHIEARRQEIARDTGKSLADFRAGQFEARSAQSVIAELQDSSSD